MFESFAAWILNTYIGDYFGNVNTDQLRMSLHSGEIELERLPLKRDLIKHLGLPLEANSGYIGKISIKFPSWHLITSEPLVITVDELFLIVKPITNFTYNEEDENRTQQEFKMSQLDTMESRWKALHEDLTNQSSYYSSSYSSWLNYGSSFVSNVLLNIHLKISSVHIRYEDYSTIPGCPFATGIVIGSIFVSSTDDQWQPKFVHRDKLSDQNLLFKLIEMESFSVYCDTDTTLYGELQFDLMVDLMRNSLEHNLNRNGNEYGEHGYIIAPVNGKCFMKRNCSEQSLKSCKQPRTVIDVQLEQVPIMMTAIQYKHLLDWSLAFNTSKTLWRYRKWRPMLHRNNNNNNDQSTKSFNCRNDFKSRIWWHFAVNANLEEYRQRRQRFNWHFILQRCRDIVSYHRSYLHYLLYPEFFTKEMRYTKDRVENEFTLDEICSIREIVFNRCDRLLKQQQQEKVALTQSLSSTLYPTTPTSPTTSVGHHLLDDHSSSSLTTTSQSQQSSSGSWFLPTSLISNLYYNYSLTAPPLPATVAPSFPMDLDSPMEEEHHPTFKEDIVEDIDGNNDDDEEIHHSGPRKPRLQRHQRTVSSSSATYGSSTDDIFLTRDAVFCQFNFQIRNSSFQLIAFNSSTDTAHNATNNNSATVGEQSFVSAISSTSTSNTLNNNHNQDTTAGGGASGGGSGNLLLEFEFTKMKIGVDITNPNAYSCMCHMNQGYRRRRQTGSSGQTTSGATPSSNNNDQSKNEAFLMTQNELNQLQFNLNFECRNLNLTLLRTDHAIISDNDAEKLATAQLTGCGIKLIISNTFIGIDGKLDSLEILDLVTVPGENRHSRVLSIGRKQNNRRTSKTAQFEMTTTNPNNDEDDGQSLSLSTFQTADENVNVVEKALSFSLSRQLTENLLRFNIEMASFCYVHSAHFVYELNLCRECFSDVLEAYFSRSFKERFKAATTEMLRGIVQNSSSNNKSSDSSTGSTTTATTDISADGSVNISISSNNPSIVPPRTTNNGPLSATSKLSLFGSSRHRNGGKRSSSSSSASSSSTMSPFVDNFKLNVFIRSPIIIFPIAPASFEVVVFHLGHMLLNNHHHSSDIMPTHLSSNNNHHNNNNRRQKKLSPNSMLLHQQQTSGLVPIHGHGTGNSHNKYHHYYNAEIRDLSVYSLDCNKNIQRFRETLSKLGAGIPNPQDSCLGEQKEEDEKIPVEELYYCDTFGVPILQKTVIEIVLEKKVLISSVGNSSAQNRSRSTTANRNSANNPTTFNKSSDSELLDGLNIISSVNTMEPPKKFSIRSHFVGSSSSELSSLSRGSKFRTKPELVLSVEISSIDVRFSYTDLLVFWHIVNTLKPSAIDFGTGSGNGNGGGPDGTTNTVPIDSKLIESKDVDILDEDHLDIEQLCKEISNNQQTKARKLSKSLSRTRRDLFGSDGGPREGSVDHQQREPQDNSLAPLAAATTFQLSELDPDEFKLRLLKLQDLGFEYGESLRALALTGGDVIEAAFMLSSNNAATSGGENINSNNKPGDSADALSDQILSSDDNHSQTTTVSGEYNNKAQQQQMMIMTASMDSELSNNGSTNLNNPPPPPSSSTNSSNTNAVSKKKKRINSASTSSNSNSLFLSSLSVIEIRIMNGSVRVIDDCNQLDIPLLELGIREFRLFQQHTSPLVEAYAQTNFYCDYYNSHLSGWEPFIEHCQVSFSWKIHEQRCHLKSMLNTNNLSGYRPQVSRRKLALKVDIKKMFNINVSRTALDLIDKVRITWINDIVGFVNQPVAARCFRKRQPFIPFALKNETGSDIKLSGLSKLFSTGKAADLVTHCDLRSTLDVKASEVVCFDLVDSEDLLSKRLTSTATSSVQSHRLSRNAFRPITPQKIFVKVDGWRVTFPVSIEREGTFIRHIVSERYFNESAILVFEISLQSSAVKLITVRSSLLITNRTTKIVELKFANTAMSDTITPYYVAPNAVFPVPLKLLYARIQLRPCDLGIGVCPTSIDWSHVRKYGEQHCSLQTCIPITHTSHASYSTSASYVVAVLVERNSIGAIIESRKIAPSVSSSSMQKLSNGSELLIHRTYGQAACLPLASHNITLLPPLQLANRLPYELKFSILNSSCSGTIRAGEDQSVHYVNPLETFNLEFTLEHFPRSKSVTISPGATKDYSTYIDMYDSNGRLLVLHAQVSIVSGGQQPCNAMTITVYAPYWVVNRSGLPLVFSQESCSIESAGQSTEHERARSISPLLFSFADNEAPQCCIMRLGRMTELIEPRWCNFFYLEKGTFYRRLRVTEMQQLQLDHSPHKQSLSAVEKMYEFGIDIRNGRDRYSHTKIVTIAPRFQIENLTSYKLEFAQKCLVEEQSSWGGTTTVNGGPSSSSLTENGFYPSYMSSPSRSSHSGYYHPRSYSLSSTGSEPVSLATSIISALPKSNMPFHWPCTDKQKLLCVRIGSSLDGSCCLWSGSFAVGSEPSVSFHLNIRDDCGRSYFIRVEILLQNATYFIVFTDANSLPPPIRVENFSQVPIEFYQSGTNNILQRTRVRPNSSVPYALDEPSLLSHITVCAPGGSSSTYDLNSSLQSTINLNYDNFYYIAFEHTFANTCSTGGSFNFTGSYMADLDDDEQLMLMMLAGPEFGLPSEGSFAGQMLVLDVPDDTPSADQTKPVVLERKERGKRSQLWRIDSQNRIVHEGSSPPLEPDFHDIGLAEVKFGFNRNLKNGSTALMVLDIDDINCNDRTMFSLVIRKMNSRRSETQTWQFTEDGRLRCVKYPNMFVQPVPIGGNNSDSVSSIFRSGTIACLARGPEEEEKSIVPSSDDDIVTNVPIEQAIMKQKMRKGSGVLNVVILADGPSRVLRIKDNQMSANGRHLQHHLSQHYSYGSPITGGQFGIERSNSDSSESFLVNLLRQTELELNVHIDSIGISVISKTNEEIIYLYMQRILLETILNPNECRVNCLVQYFQVDNQLRHHEKEVVLYVANLDVNSESSTPSGPSSFESVASGSNLPTAAPEPPISSSSLASLCPSISFNAHKLFIPNVETNVFKSLQVTINDLVLNIEELVLLKLLEFIRYDPVDSEMDEISGISSANVDHLYHANRNVSSSLARSVQYYFANLLIDLSRVKLSVFTSAQKLTSYLADLKKKAGIKLIRFEEALIQLRPFQKVYSLMTRRFVQDSITEHYRSELRSQAAKILGTVDFLGNPVGFLNNLADGFNELINEGSFSGLIWNVTHGISDSTAKVTSVLSESLGSVTMDARYQEIRRKIKQEGSIGGQRSHLSAGALGLAHGILGGITSVITQTYDGVVTQGGVTGLLSGFGKGILGTFTKPAVGMLDFASGAATAVRDSSRKSNSLSSPAKRVRLPRTLTIDGRLSTYDSVQARWQSRLYNTNDFGSREYGEQFVHVFSLSDRHFLLLTTERLYFFHSTLARCSSQMAPPPRSSTYNSLNGEDYYQFIGFDMPEHHHDNDSGGNGSRNGNDEQIGSISGSSIFQLQIISLESFTELAHYQMMPFDADRFVRNNGGQQTCLNSFGTIVNKQVSSTSTASQQQAQTELFNFIEFRTASSATSSNSHLNNNSNYSSYGRSVSANNNHQRHHYQSSASSVDFNNKPPSQRPSAPSPALRSSNSISGGQSPLITSSGIEYPKSLSLCYIYCDNFATTAKLVHLVNEAKHLHEERKYEVTTLIDNNGSGNGNNNGNGDNNGNNSRY